MLLEQLAKSLTARKYIQAGQWAWTLPLVSPAWKKSPFTRSMKPAFLWQAAGCICRGSTLHSLKTTWANYGIHNCQWGFVAMGQRLSFYKHIIPVYTNHLLFIKWYMKPICLPYAHLCPYKMTRSLGRPSRYCTYTPTWSHINDKQDAVLLKSQPSHSNAHFPIMDPRRVGRNEEGGLAGQCLREKWPIKARTGGDVLSTLHRYVTNPCPDFVARAWQASPTGHALNGSKWYLKKILMHNLALGMGPSFFWMHDVQIHSFLGERFEIVLLLLQFWLLTLPTWSTINHFINLG